MISNARLLLYCILAGSFIARLVLYQPHGPMWDASAYILMGKYLASYGSVGLIEPFRPLAWPLALGFSYSVGLDPMTAGTVVQILMSLGCIALTYGIGAMVYGRATGLIAAILLSVSPSFMFWGHQWYSEIPALFCTLAACFWFLRGKYFLAGLLAVLSFFTKFTGALGVAVLLVAAVYQRRATKSWRPLANFVLGGVLMALPFLMLQLFLYEDVRFPFQQGADIYAQGLGPSWIGGLRRTVTLIVSLDPVIFLGLVGLIYLRWKGHVGSWIVAILGLLSVVWIGRMPTSIIRYALLAMPFLYLLSADGFVKILAWCRRRHCGFLPGLLLLFFVTAQVVKIAGLTFGPSHLDRIQQYVRDHQRELQGNIWISSPVMLAFSDLRADELLYYPVFNLDKARHLQSRLHQAQVVLIDTRDIPCAPLKDAVCDQARRDFFADLKTHLTAVDRVDFPDGNMRAIFRKQE